MGNKDEFVSYLNSLNHRNLVFEYFLYYNQLQSNLMHSKIYKAKLIAVHSAKKEQKLPESQEKASSIHAYFGMLQHIFQRNRNLINSLKLSGTKIQQKNRQIIKGCFRSKRPSESVSSKITLQMDFDTGVEQFRRQKSQTKYAFPAASCRNFSVQPRYPSKQPQKVVSEQNQELSQFIPIGQASLRINLTNQKAAPEKLSMRTKEITTFDFKNNIGLKQVRTEREIVKVNKKHSLRASRRILRIKSEGSQVPTNASSIRTTQKSYVQANSVIKFQTTPQQMTPW